MIKVEPCKGCSSVLLVDEFMGVRVRCNPAPLDTPAAGQALVGGQSLYRVVYEGGRPHSFTSASPAILGALRGTSGERPVVVAQHRCTGKALTAPVAEVKTESVVACPKGPEKPAQGAARGHSAQPATPRRSEGPRCSGCGSPCEDGSYGAIHLGDLLIWAHHVANCP